VQTISGRNAAKIEMKGDFWGSRKDKPESVYLGEIRTDPEGRLVVLAGRGTSASITDPKVRHPLLMTDFDSADWFDDTCDGWIDVTVEIQGHKQVDTFVIDSSAK
jgi:hypothetical protein